MTIYMGTTATGDLLHFIDDTQRPHNWPDPMSAVIARFGRGAKALCGAKIIGYLRNHNTGEPIKYAHYWSGRNSNCINCEARINKYTQTCSRSSVG